MKSTKIEKIETILWSRWLILKIFCEDGTVGIGEAGVHGWQKPTETMLKVCEPYLIGKDPNFIEHHYQFLYRNSHFMGSIIKVLLLLSVCFVSRFSLIRFSCLILTFAFCFASSTFPVNEK